MSEQGHTNQDGFFPKGSYAGGPFMQKYGPAHARGEAACQIKICFVATDLPYLVNIIRDLAERQDCYAVKYSTHDRDGMFLGRCFLTDAETVGQLVQTFKSDPKLMTTCQDDNFFLKFRALSIRKERP